jgi:MFS transporter, FHS family, glucose/mannose:H+ symporter
MSSHPSHPSVSPRRLAPLFIATAAWGLVTVMLGPLLPSLIARWHIQDAQAGSLFTASFLGQLVGAWFAARNLRRSLLWGAALSSAATAALAWSSYPVAHIAFFVAGIGISLGLASGNIVAGTSTIQRAQTLALFNISWSTGAIACSLLARLSAPLHPRLFFFIASIFMALAGALVSTLPGFVTKHRTTVTRPLSSLPLPTLPLLLFAITMLLYIGNENALGGWLPSFAERNHALVHASTIALLYWLSELASRLLMVSLLRNVSEIVLYRACVFLLLLTLMATLITPHPGTTLVITSAILIGAAMGPLYPLIVSFLLERTGDHPGLGPLFASASLGGATLPWLTGVLSTRFGGLRTGLLVPVAGALLMMALSSAIAPQRHD